MNDMHHGLLTLSRVSGADDSEEVVVTLADESTGLPVMTVRMSVRALGDLVTGRAHVPCAFRLDPAGVQNAGKAVERKAVKVPLPAGELPCDEEAYAVFVKAGLVVDGWVPARLSDLANPHTHRHNVDGSVWSQTEMVRYV